MMKKDGNKLGYLVGVVLVLLIGIAIYLLIQVNIMKRTMNNYVSFQVDNVEYQKVEMEDGYLKNVPQAPKKDGYIFSYWEIDGEKLDISKKYPQKSVVKAIYEKIINNDNQSSDKNDNDSSQRPTLQVTEYVVLFNPNNGGSAISIKVEKDSKVLEPTQPVKLGYKFIGWYSGDAKFNFNTKITSNITLTAKWEKVNTPSTTTTQIVNNTIKYGDVTEDGKIDIMDTVRLSKYINGQVTLSEQALKNADVNLDDEITNSDYIIILESVSGWYELPNKNYIKYGDVTEDGKIDIMDTIRLSKYVEWTTDSDFEKPNLTKQALKNADVNVDGKINKDDYDLILKYVSGWNVKLGK